MKKFLSLTGIIAIAALVSTNAYAAGTATPHPADHAAQQAVDQQAVYDQTADLRASLAADQAELNALMASENPDAKRVRVLAENISKAQDELRRKTGGHGSMMMAAGGAHMAMMNRHGNNHMNGMNGMNGGMNGAMGGSMGGCMR